MRSIFQQIPRSVVVKQMDRESNAYSKASVQGSVWLVDRKKKKKKKEVRVWGREIRKMGLGKIGREVEKKS